MLSIFIVAFLVSSFAGQALANPLRGCKRHPLKNEEFDRLSGRNATHWEYIDLPNFGTPDVPPFPKYKFAPDPAYPTFGNAFQVKFPAGFNDPAPVTQVLLEQEVTGICDATYNVQVRYRSDSPHKTASCAVEILLGNFPPSLKTVNPFFPTLDYQKIDFTFALDSVGANSRQRFYLGVGCRIESDLPATVYVQSVNIVREDFAT